MATLIAAAIFYWLIGVYVSCWGMKIKWPNLDIGTEDVFISMTLLWALWPLTIFGIFLDHHFNE